MNTTPHPEIPKGLYCYGQTGRCPYFAGKEVNGVAMPWCKFLNKGSVPNAITDDEVEKLIEAWGVATVSQEQAESRVRDGFHATTEEALAFRTFNTPPEWDLFLLWDSCKECGLNEDFPEADCPRPTEG